MQYWNKLSKEQQSSRIEIALHENVNFRNGTSLGMPASALDEKVFPDDVSFMKDAPILQSFVTNPNNIGCHTTGKSETAFRGTQNIEREVLSAIAVDIFKAQIDGFDGYIASGGTEANIQAAWIYRNIFIQDYNASADEIALVSSEDTHYSIPKASNLLMIDWLKIPVDFETRAIDEVALNMIICNAKQNGKKYFIAVANMGTTMFGSVDDPEVFVNAFKQNNVLFKLHIDAAYGGFFYPFSNPNSILNFENLAVSSITIDAHKLLQAPYGTGIFLCRKNLMKFALTREAEYINGMDLTLCGSRSGTNAIAVWSILSTYGKHGWFEKISVLQMRTNWLCNKLDELGVDYFRDKFLNIVTIKSNCISASVAKQFGLIPQQYSEQNKWFKIVVMDHVKMETLENFTDAIKQDKSSELLGV